MKRRSQSFQASDPAEVSVETVAAALRAAGVPQNALRLTGPDVVPVPRAPAPPPALPRVPAFVPQLAAQLLLIY